MITCPFPAWFLLFVKRWRAISLLVAVALFGANAGFAAPKTWTGGSNGNFNTAANWSPSGVPAAGDDLTFPAGPARLLVTNDFSPNRAFRSILISGSNYFVRGSAILVTNGITSSNPTGVNTFDAAVDVRAAQSWEVQASNATLDFNGAITLNANTLTVRANPGAFIFSGVVSGSGNLIKTNAGTLRIDGASANTYTGFTRLDHGTLDLIKAGVAISGDLIVGDGNGLLSSDVVTLFADNQIAETATVTIKNSGLLDFAGQSNRIGNLVLQGGRTATASHTAGPDGVLVLIGNVTTLPDTNTALIHSELSLGGATRTFTVAAGAAAPDLRISARISSGGASAGLIKQGNGTLQLSNTKNVYDGVTTINAGELWLLGTVGSILGDPAAGTIINSNAVLVLNGAAVDKEGLTINSTNASGALTADGAASWLGDIVLNSPISIRSENTLVLGGVISGGGGFTKLGPGAVELTGTNSNTYRDITYVKVGVLLLNKDPNRDAMVGGLVIGEDRLPENTEIVRHLQSFQLPSSFSITLNASGLLDLNGFSDTIGSLTFNGGDIATGAGAITPAGVLTVNPNANSQAVIAGRMTLSGSRTINATGHSFSPDLRIDAQVGGSGSMIKNGVGEVALTSSNTYSGLTTVNDGVLFVDNSFALGSTNNGTIVNSGGALVLRSNIQVTDEQLTLAGSGQSPFGAFGSVLGSNTWVGNILLSSNTTISVNAPATNFLHVVGGITGPFDLTQTDVGTLIFCGNVPNSFGNMLVRSGVLRLEKSIPNGAGPVELTIGDGSGGVGADVVRLTQSEQISSSTAIHIASSGLLDINDLSDTTGSIDGAGRIDLGSGTLAAGNDGGSTEFSGRILGTGHLTKVGGGTWTLTDDSTNLLVLTASAGTLLVNGSLSNCPVSVSTGATFGGIGIVSTVTVSGHLSPGVGPGVLTCSNVTFASGGDFIVELNGPDPGPGYDQLAVPGFVALGNATLRVSTGFAPFEGEEFVILSNEGTDTIGGTFNGLPNGAVFTANNLKFQIRYGIPGNDVVLTLTNTPLRVGGFAIVGGNGDGNLGPNQCNLINVVISNLTGSALSGVVGTLVGRTPGVAVTGNSATYPTIAGFGRATNSTPFQVSIGPGLVCGADINFDLIVQTPNNGTFAIPFSVPTGSAGDPVRFDSNTPTGIPDNGSVDVPISVSGISSAIKQVSVSLRLAHPADGQLDISLIGPDGTTIDLSSGNGASGANYGIDCVDLKRTTFSDLAATSITSASAPFAGVFRAEQSFLSFYNKSGSAVNGTWRLHLADRVVGSVGSLQCWSLFLSPTVCRDGGGPCTACPTGDPPGTQRLIQGILGPGSLTQTNRVSRRGSGSASVCGQNTNCPGTISSPVGTRFYYDAYTFENGEFSACIFVSLRSTGDLFCAVYTNSVNSTNLCQNYLADAGTSTAVLDGVTSNSFSVGPGARFVIVVNGVAPDVGGAYTLGVSGGACRPQRCDSTSQSTNFWLTIPGNASPDLGESTHPYVAVVGAQGTVGTVEIPGLQFQAPFQIGSSMSATVQLPTAADLGNSLEVIENKGVHITSSADVGVTLFNDLAFTTDAYLVTPAGVLGRHHVVMAYGNWHDDLPQLNGSELALIAISDDTFVQIQLSAPVGTHAKGEIIGLSLNQGQTYQLRATNSGRLDLTGTLIDSDRPIAVFAGHQCATIPNSNVFFCNYVCEQVYSTNGWGTNFFSVPLAQRSNDTFRVVASVNNTLVRTNGILAANLAKAGDFVEFQLKDAARIGTTQPAFVAQFGNSSDYDRRRQADPTMITLPSPERWLDTYTIFCPSNFSNFVNVAIPIAGQMEVTLDGVRLSQQGLLTDTGKGFLMGQVPVTPGTHRLSGSGLAGFVFAAPFLAAVYGHSTNQYDAYGYVAGIDLPDGTPPALTAPSTILLGVGGDCLAKVPLVPVIAVDNCTLPESLVRTQAPPAGVTVAVGRYTITNTILDSFGNLSRLLTSLIVSDSRTPTITCPTNLTIECTNPAGNIVTFTVPATNACGAPVSVICVPPSGSLFRFGTSNVVCTTSDQSVPATQCSFSVTIRDTNAPVLSCRPIITTSPDGGRVIVTYFPDAVSAIDSCSSNVTIVCTPPSGSSFAVGQSNVTCTATDAHGNTSPPCTFPVLVREPPLVVSIPGFTGGKVKISFPTLSGSNYAVEFKSTFSPANLSWNLLTNVTGVGGTVSVTDTNPATGPSRFFRVRR